MSFTILIRILLLENKDEKLLAITFNNYVLKGIISCDKSTKMIF